jgi:DNA-binding NarL/FixJ family response regulator
MRVVIAEDQALLREALVRFFTDYGHAVVAAMADADGLGDVVRATEPHLVVMDIRMPPTFSDEGSRHAACLKRDHPGVGVLLLSQHIETTHVAELVGQEGFGYLLKDRVLDVDEFLRTAERVANGGSALDPKVVASLLRPTDTGSPLARLTERERDVLELMAEGLTNTAIAQRLCVSERTVEAHVRQILVKLDIAEHVDANRRVLAVLTLLRNVHGWR